MGIFQLIQIHLKLFGIDASHQNKSHRSSFKNLFARLMILLTCIWTNGYLLFKVESFREAADCYYISSSFICAFINCSSLTWNTAKLFELIKNIESCIQKRELLKNDPKKQSLFLKMVKIDYWSQSHYFRIEKNRIESNLREFVCENGKMG